MSKSRRKKEIAVPNRKLPTTKLQLQQLEDRTTPANFLVTTASDAVDANDGLISLREAITSANNNGEADSITFSTTVFALPQTITLTQGELRISDDLTITGPAARVTIDANKQSQVFNVDDGTTTVKTVTIDGFTITGGYIFGFGGGIRNAENLTIQNNILSGNTASNSGGGILNYGMATILNSTLTGNTASNGGGGILNRGTTTVHNSTLSGNTAFNIGGGIFNDGTATIQNSSGNTAFNIGGGIFNNGKATIQNSTLSGNSRGGIYNGATATVQNSTLSGNSSGGILNAGTATIQNSTLSGNSGGAISNRGTATVQNSTLSGNSGSGIINGGTATVQNSTLSGNTVSNGGGILNAGTVTVQNSTLTGNTASNGGGGILNTGTATIENSTLSGNSAGFGSGIAIYNTATIRNSTISGNSASGNGGGGIFNSGTATIESTIISGNTGRRGSEIWNQKTIHLNANNLIGSNPIATTQALDNVIIGATEITATSDGTWPTDLAAILSPLASNGGLTQTHALVAGSPAINAGGTTSLTTDQRGIARPQGTASDIGAFEARQLTPSLQLSKSTFDTADSSSVIASPDGGTFTVFDSTNQQVNGILVGNTLRTTTTGSYTLRYTVTSADGIISTISTSFTVVTPLQISAPTSIPPFWARVHTGTNIIDLPITGGVGPYQIVDAATSLPPGFVSGVSFDGRTVQVTTSPTNYLLTTAGDFSTKVTIQDANGNQSSVDFVIPVSGENPVTMTTPPNSVIYFWFDSQVQNNFSAFATNKTRQNDNQAANIVLTSIDSVPAIPGGASSLFTFFQGGPDGVDSNGVPQVRFISTPTNSITLPTPGTYQLRFNYQFWGVTFFEDRTMVVLGPRSLDAPTRTAWTVNQPGFSSSLTINNNPPQLTIIRQISGLPTGLSALIRDGKVVIEGTPTVSGSFPVSMTVTGQSSPFNAGTANFILTINPTPTLDALSKPTVPVNSNYLGSIPILNGTGPFSNLTQSGLPQGITAVLNVQGTAIELSGTPTVRGNYNNLQFSVTDASGAIASGTFSMSVTEAARPVVTTNLDKVDAFDGLTSLREAIHYANSHAGSDSITFGDGSTIGGTNFLDSTPDTILLTQGQLTLSDTTGTTTITGNGAENTIISGNNASRVLWVNPLVTAMISGLTITQGRVVGADSFVDGAGVFNVGTLTVYQSILSNNIGYSSVSQGGGIYNAGRFSLVESTVSDSFAGATGAGSGIFNTGNATISRSMISRNRGAGGAGVLNSGTMTISQSTFIDNTAGFGGGISNNGTLIVTQSTFTGNSAGVGGAVLNSGSATVRNSLIVGNTANFGPEIDGTYTDGGGNIIGLNAGETLGQILQVDVNGKPLLANNGGPTQTVALVAGSRAINTGLNANAVDSDNQHLTTDQRGSNRIAGGTVDIGAFEVQTVSTMTSLTSSVVSSIYGDSVQFTATINSAELVQSGSVQFSIDGDTFGSPVSLVNGEASFTISSLTAGSHSIAASYIPAENSLFLASDSSISFDVAKKAASVTPTSVSKIYGSADPTLTGSLSGFLASDNVTATYTRVAGENVKTGGYAITATLQPSEVVGNYEISYGTGTFTITPKDATVTIDNKSKFFGFADPTLTGSISGFLTSDNISAIYTRVAGETVGNYEIRATLSPTELLGNYNILTTNGNLQIKALPPTFAYDFDNAARFTASGFQSVQGITLPSVGGTTPTLYTPGGFGWVGTAPNAVDQGSIFGASQPMLRDFNTDSVSRTFRTDVGMSNTDYFVTAIVGASLNGMTITGANGTIIHPGLEADQLANIVTPAGQAMSLRFKVTSNAAGQIDLTFGNKNAGQSWSIAGLILRETSIHSPLTITRQDSQTTAVSADGTTEDTYVVTGANPGALMDIAVSLGTITSVSTTGLAGSWTSDASTILAGKQVVADAAGKFSFKLRRPNSPTATSAKMVIHQFDGTTHGEFTQSYTGFSAPMQPLLSRKIDLDSVTSNIPNTYTPTGWENYTAKIYDASPGYGWTNIAGLTARYTASYSVPGDTVTSLLNRDSHLSTQTRDFQIDVAPNTIYSIEVGLGDARGVYDKMKVEFVGGTSQSNLATTATNRFIKTTVTGMSDANGKITVRFSSLGTAGYAVSYISATPVLGQLNTNSLTASANGSGNNIATANVQTLVGTAIDFWAKAGATQSQISTLQNATVTVADLGGSLLGTASTGQIIIDDNAAGAGWSTSTTSVQSGKYDLLTVLMHEMGHLLGLDDVYKPGSTSLMTGKLEAGTRKLPTVSDLQSSIAPIQVSTQVSPMPTIGGSKATPTVSIPSIDLVQAVDPTTVVSARRR
jgi:hypothetical protein